MTLLNMRWKIVVHFLRIPLDIRADSAIIPVETDATQTGDSTMSATMLETLDTLDRATLPFGYGDEVVFIDANNNARKGTVTYQDIGDGFRLVYDGRIRIRFIGRSGDGNTYYCLIPVERVGKAS